MKTVRNLLLSLISFAVSVLSLHGQPVSLPDDSRVVKGELDNGLVYYVIQDAGDKGVADYCLLRRVGKIDEQQAGNACGYSLVAAASAFGGTQLMSSGDIFRLAASSGLRMWKDAGFFVSDDFTMFNVCGVRSGTSSADSVLLFLYDVARGMDYSQARIDSITSVLGGLYPVITSGKGRFMQAGPDAASLNEFVRTKTPMSQQAIVVVGDVDVQRTVRDIALMFMTIPSREFTGDNPYYLFKGSDTLNVSVVKTSERNTYADIYVSYMAKALPFALRNSVVSVISSQMKDYMANLIGRRVRRLADEGLITVAGCSVNTSEWGSARDAEVLTVSLRIPAEQTDRAVYLLASELSDIDASGFSFAEYVYARKCYANRCVDTSPGENRHFWVRRAVQNYMENGSLSSEQAERDYLLAHPIKDSAGWSYLNRFASTLIDDSRNIRINVFSPDATLNDSLVSGYFRKGWQCADSSVVAVRESSRNFADTSFFRRNTGRCRALFTRNETVTNSQVIHLSNGAKVYYRQFPQDRFVRFVFSFRGGYGTNRYYRDGYSAFASDWMKIDSVAGMPYRDFEEMLASYGVELEYEFDIKGFSVSGKAPVESTDIVWRAVDAVINGRSPDRKAFDAYVNSEKIRLSDVSLQAFRRDTLDALMHPAKLYSEVKRPDVLERADYDDVRNFMAVFSNMRHSPFIAFSTPMGIEDFKDIAASECVWVKKGKRIRKTSVMEETACSGKITSRLAFVMDNPYKSMDILFSMPMSYTAENLFISEMAASMIEYRINMALVGYGVSSSVETYFRALPKERTYLHISVPFMASMLQVNALSDVKNAICSQSWNDQAYFETVKNDIVNRRLSAENMSAFWINAVKERYADNKDFVSLWQEKAGAVTYSQVQDYIERISGSGSVELLVRGVSDDNDIEE